METVCERTALSSVNNSFWIHLYPNDNNAFPLDFFPIQWNTNGEREREFE